jgi:hypothetical protein
VASAEAKLKLQPENEVLRTSGTKLHLTVLVSITELVATLLPEKDGMGVSSPPRSRETNTNLNISTKGSLFLV